MKKKIVFSFILGILISSVAYAAVSLSSDKISYKDTTVDAALDNLFGESLNGKAKIAEAITNKGIETLDTDSYDTIVANINSISTGDPYLRYDEGTGYIQVLDTEGNWYDYASLSELPMNPIRTATITIPLTYETRSHASAWHTGSPVGAFIHKSSASADALGNVVEILDISPSSVSFTYGGYTATSPISATFDGKTITVVAVGGSSGLHQIM